MSVQIVIIIQTKKYNNSKINLAKLENLKKKWRKNIKLELKMNISNTYQTEKSILVAEQKWKMEIYLWKFRKSELPGHKALGNKKGM